MSPPRRRRSSDGSDDDDDGEEEEFSPPAAKRARVAAAARDNDEEDEDEVESQNSESSEDIFVGAGHYNGWSDDEEEEEQQETTTATATTPTHIHMNIKCDECGEAPIVGTRYKSIVQPNYDVCHVCLTENHAPLIDDPTTLATQFVVLPTTDVPVPDIMMEKTAAVLLNSVDDLRLVTPELEDVDLFVGGMPEWDDELADQTRSLLQSHANLKTVHVCIYAPSHAYKMIQVLAEGLCLNTSVTTVSWNILPNMPTKAPLMEKEAAAALQSLVETNTTIQYMFFRSQDKGGFAAPVPFPSSLVEGVVNLADYLFPALTKTHLHTFRFASCFALEDSPKKKAWEAMQNSPRLKRIKASFVNPDYYLDLLTLDKKHQWMERWTTRDGDRWNVWKEVMKSDLYNDDDNNNNLVPLLYHFLRKQPDVWLLPSA